MREREYRGWNIKQKYYYYSSNRVCENNLGTFFDHRVNDSKDWIIEDYIGLFDRNKKKVFEGDIVEEGKLRWTVEWVGDRASFMMICHDGCSSAFMRGFYGVVIGNINENKDLLK